MRLAIDSGHETTKCYDGQKEIIFESLLGETQSTLMRNNGHLPQITTIDGQWLVGKAARIHSVTRTRGKDSSWAFKPGYRALLLFGISEFASPETGSVVVDLAAGLPIADFIRNREAISKTLVGEHYIERPGRRNLTISLRNIAFLPQGFAPAKPWIKPGLRVGVLDLGSRTINHLGIRDEELIGSQAASVEQGATPVLREIATRIERETGRLYHPLEVVEILKGKGVRVSGQPVDVSETIDYCRDAYFQSVETLISEIWGDATKLDHLLVFGGGALLIGDRLMETYSQAQILPDPQMASVRSLYAHAKRIFR